MPTSAPPWPLVLQALKHLKLTALKTSNFNYSAQCTLTQECRNCILWWLKRIPTAMAPIRRGHPTIVMYTDASGYAWGSFCNGHYAQGFFSTSKLPLSINSKETLAIWYCLRAFQPLLHFSHVLVLSDNTTTISYVHNMGGMSSELRNKITRDIWTYAVQNHIWLSISHIPGVENVDADLASHVLNPHTEWSLPQNVFDLVCQKFNFYPVLDLFASRLNNKTSRYMSYCPDPFCEAVDAFTVPWNSDRLYLFPPFSLLGKCLRKLQTDGGRALVVLPYWPTQWWWPLIGPLLETAPFHLPPPLH